jgi:hypothetical protein
MTPTLQLHVPESDSAAGRIIARALADQAPERIADIVSVTSILNANHPATWSIRADRRDGRQFYVTVPAFATAADAAAALLRVLP